VNAFELFNIDVWCLYMFDHYKHYMAISPLLQIRKKDVTKNANTSLSRARWLIG